MNTARRLHELLDLRTAPIAISFRPVAPAGLPKVAAAGPSGCTYWKRAAEGEAFYTDASDHHGCPIGSYTHGVELPPEKAKELEGVVGMMVQLNYIRMEEIPSIPRRQEPFGVAIYSPLASAPVEPDVVMMRGNAKQMMLLAEAAHAAGVGAESPMMGRPTCAAIPAVMQTNRSASSLGCIGNRVYTELGDDEFYFAVPGKQIAAVVEKLAVIVHANRELEAYHRARTA